MFRKRKIKSLNEQLNDQYDYLARAIAKEKKTELYEDLFNIMPNNNWLNLMNPSSLPKFTKIFVKEFTKHINTKFVYSATLIDSEFDFGNEKGKFKPNKIKKKFKRLLKGLNYIGNVSFAPYCNRKTEKGQLRSIHCHFLMWERVPRRTYERISSSVDVDRQRCIPLYIKEYPINNAVQYIWHSPANGYASIVNLKGKHSNIKRKLSLKQLYKIYNFCRFYRVDDLTFAGGEGKEIWKAIKSKIDKFVERGHTAEYIPK